MALSIYKVACLQFLLVCANAFAQAPAMSNNLFQKMYAEKMVQYRDQDGTTRQRLAPAEEIWMGQQVLYTVQFANTTGQTVARPTVICELPQFMTFVPDVVVGPGATVTFSIDGGRSFAGDDDLYVFDQDGQLKPAPPEAITHIRWELDRPMAPGSTGYARFSAKRTRTLESEARGEPFARSPESPPTR